MDVVPQSGKDTQASPAQVRGSAGHDQLEARYEATYQREAGRVYRYALRRGCTSAEAEDVVAETFLVLWRQLPKLSDDDCLPWLLAVARRVLANKYRAERRFASFLAGLPRVTGEQKPAGAQVEARELLREAMRLLGEKDREAIMLVSWDGLSHAQAAQALGCTEKALTARVGRARARLVELLGL